MTGSSSPTIQPGIPSARLAASRQHDREVAAKALRDAAREIRGSTADLDPQGEVSLLYINCTAMDARMLETRADAIERGAAENLARWRDEAGVLDSRPPWVEYQRAREVAAHEAMPALLGFAEALTSAHQPYEEHGYRWCRCCRFSWPCPIASLAEQHLGGGS